MTFKEKQQTFEALVEAVAEAVRLAKEMEYYPHNNLHLPAEAWEHFIAFARKYALQDSLEYREYTSGDYNCVKITLIYKNAEVYVYEHNHIPTNEQTNGYSLLVNKVRQHKEATNDTI